LAGGLPAKPIGASFGKCERFREMPILDLRRSQLVTLLGGAAAGALLSLVELGD
jgi:hypothetical protein